MSVNREALARLRERVDQRVAQKAQQFRNQVVEELSTPGQGRVYKRGGAEHRASKPGEAPAVDQSRLRQSISVQRVGEGKYRVGTNLETAPLLEFGTRTIAPRPAFRPAVEKFRRR